MRLKIGGMKTEKTILGIRCLVLYSANPITQLIKAIQQMANYRSLGLIRFITLPGIRITIVKKRKSQND